jgi:hypothetical protein
MSRARRVLLGVVALAVAVAIWLPCMRFVFRPRVSDCLSPQGVPPVARRLAARHIHLWTDPASRAAETERMRGSNAEWDFMGRTFLVLSLANTALRDPAMMPACLEITDRIIDETLRLEREKGLYFFLMPYARRRPWVLQPPRSQFLDGEIALMLAVRRFLDEREAYRAPLRERVDRLQERAAP